jgi:hypothetical protein
MCSLWLWVLRMAPDGDLGSFDGEDLEIAAEWEGESGKFIESVNARGLIDIEQHGMVVHDWGDYATHLKAAERKRIQRQKKRERDAVSQDVTGQSRDVTGQGSKKRHVTLTDRPTDQKEPTRPDRPKDIGSRRNTTMFPKEESLLDLPVISDKGHSGGGIFHVTQPMVDQWQKTYPTLDVMGELRKALQWTLDDTGRRKTKRGARKFLGGWLGRAQNQGRGRTPERPKTNRELAEQGAREIEQERKEGRGGLFS